MQPTGTIARVLFTIKDGEMALLHGFIKKSRKTSLENLDVARKRKRQWLGGRQ